MASQPVSQSSSVLHIQPIYGLSVDRMIGLTLTSHNTIAFHIPRI